MTTRRKKTATPRKPATTEAEWWQLLKSKDSTFIRSAADWRKALANPRTSPLAGCDPETIREFTKNLRFNNGGLAHANYGVVAKKLTYDQFSRLWGMFGLDMGMFADYKDKECKSTGTCRTSFGDVCTSNC